MERRIRSCIWKKDKARRETFLKKITSKLYYRLLKIMTSVEVPVDTGDFRLIDRKVCNALISLPEKNRYVRGLVSWVGYRHTSVEFIRQERYAGETKYPLKKMLKLAFDGITSLSYKPLIIAGHFGFLAFAIGAILMFTDFIKSILNQSEFVNFTLMIGLNMMMFGVTLGCIGIMGQYIGRIFDESKGRPIYIIDSTRNYNNDDKKYKVVNLEHKTI